MANQIGRLRPVGFAKRGAVPATVINAGTFISPTQFVRFLPPHNWYPAIALLESPAISAAREIPIKAVKGAASLAGLKSNLELEPTDVFGNLFTAAWGQDTVTGDGVVSAHAHNFSGLASAQLPVYDWWHNEGDKQFGFASMMNNKFDLIMNKGETIRLEQEWAGLYYVDGLALAPATTYPTPRHLMFAQIDLSLAGLLTTAFQAGNIAIENQVVADHTLRSDTNYASRIWTEHQMVTGKLEAFFEDATEYDKFLAAASPSTPTSTSIDATITSSETFVEGALPATAFKYLLQAGKVDYRTAEVPLPAGIIKVTFTFVALPFSGTIGAGGNAFPYTAKSLVAQFINGVPGAY